MIKERKLMVEVTEEEYEIIRKGIKLSDMTTEDLIYEIISRCHDKETVDGDILSGTATLIGKIELSKDEKMFRFKLENYSIPRPKLRPFILPSTHEVVNIEDSIGKPMEITLEANNLLAQQMIRDAELQKYFVKNSLNDIFEDKSE